LSARSDTEKRVTPLQGARVRGAGLQRRRRATARPPGGRRKAHGRGSEADSARDERNEAIMTPSLFLDNLLAWGAQVAMLVATAALVSRRWPHARARLAFWQGILTLSVLLPLIGPWYQRPLQAIPNIVAAGTISTGFETVVAAQRRSLSTMDLLPWILVGGAVLRLARVGARVLGLRTTSPK